MSELTIKRVPPWWRVMQDDQLIGTVWYGGGSYWYNVVGFSDYPIGHAPENQVEMTIEKLARRVQREYAMLQEVSA